MKQKETSVVCYHGLVSLHYSAIYLGTQKLSAGNWQGRMTKLLIVL